MRDPILPLVPVVLALLVVGGCVSTGYDPARATRPYPFDLHVVAGDGESAAPRPRTVDMEVFREGEWLEIVNSTARSYENIDLWINQRYMRHVDRLDAGTTRRLPLREFYDERGEPVNAGGFWATVEPTAVRLVEIQPAGGEPLVGLITIRAEPAQMPRPRRR